MQICRFSAIVPVQTALFLVATLSLCGLGETADDSYLSRRHLSDRLYLFTNGVAIILTYKLKMEQIQTALGALKVLRSGVGQVFYSLANGIRAEHGEENKENKYLSELQDLLTTVGTNLR